MNRFQLHPWFRGPKKLTVHLEIDTACKCPAYYSECVAWPLPLISSSAAPGDVCVASTSGDPGPSRSVWPDCGEQMLAGGGCVSNEAS